MYPRGFHVSCDLSMVQISTPVFVLDAADVMVYYYFLRVPDPVPAAHDPIWGNIFCQYACREQRDLV